MVPDVKGTHVAVLHIFCKPHHLMESFSCLRLSPVTFAFLVAGGMHSFSSFQKEKHLDWMRIGGFLVSSGSVLATDSLELQKPFFNPDGDLPSRVKIHLAPCALLLLLGQAIMIHRH